MRFLSAFCVALILVMTLHRAHAQQSLVSPDPNTVSVLYVSNTLTASENDESEIKKANAAAIEEITSFLKMHFCKVGFYDRSEQLFPDRIEEAAVGYDVVVVDWRRLIPEDTAAAIRSKIDPSESRFDATDGYFQTERRWYPFPKHFSKPMVIMGQSVALIMPEGSLDILETIEKREWMPWSVSFVGDYAYGTDSNHPIFREPLTAPIEWEPIPKPLSFYLYPGTLDLGETIRAWKIQKDPSPPLPRGVSCPRRYFDATKDAEVIACAMDDKPDSVVIGRHGNRLVWGYSSDPSEMTATGQAAFINAICYMTNFKKRPGEVTRTEDRRFEFLESIYLTRGSTNFYTFANAKEIEKLLQTARVKIEGVDPKSCAELVQKEGQEYTKQLMKTLPRDISDPFDGDVEKLVTYYTDNYEYLYLDPRHRYVVDEEAKSLGMSVRSPDFLQRCITLLNSSKDTETALLLLKRYVGRFAETPAQWRAWYESEGKTWGYREWNTKFHSPNDEE